ncbi:hypothetical protein JNX00_11485 [Hydrogenophaga sp. YM1]|jgi:hypothetical protein|uniref:hypothetical protein n=1 Tax=Hydrogenophaga TaxID=47420 RepID=UPI00086EA1BD|nr:MULTISPECIES: hypothetical protein [unclassified Hydrogenophaga]MBN9371082.1 hypothetical protein [Hydrogenophaga sp.]ODT33847.1 MAG: hypothetical protein ABS53_03480 [Hydrogenophaga sp. SCN 70-13]OJV71219.1 MAG: hypothetical protein BGO22_18160 [Hydrogenophaga sp. 70-12]QRR32315.1 hypothetical protein JNX00_11485 [Hydrogenophaga sp. YM1]
MSPALQAIAHPLREHGPVLLADVNDPHDEVLALVWGPRFDREHAMWLWSRLSRRAPQQAVPVLPALMGAAERFDALDVPAQRRVRRLILRHRALRAALAV